VLEKKKENEEIRKLRENLCIVYNKEVETFKKKRRKKRRASSNEKKKSQRKE